MSLIYNVIFNSGTANEFNYEATDANIEGIKIINSDQSYYQTASVQIDGISSTEEDLLDINNTVIININNDRVFDGYVNRIRTSIAGTKVYDIQAIGRTYDLWRFVTSSSVSFTNKYTSYIVSSLVHTYCSGNGFYVTPPVLGPTSGSFINYVEFPNMEIGSCIGRMAQLDGYTFYVGSDAVLNYYKPVTTVQFTIGESDIIEMSPYEISDDSMKNDVLVIGSVEYEKFSEKIKNPIGYHYISGTRVGGSDGKYIAQRITIPSDLHTDWLSSIKFYLDRSIGDNTPYYLKGGIRKDDSGSPSSNASIFPTSNVYPSSDALKFIGTDVMSPPDWTPYYTYSSPESFPITGGQTIWLVFNYDGATESKYWKLAYAELLIPEYGDPITYDPNFTETWNYGGKEYGDVGYDAGNQHIYFCASSIGYAANETFDNDGSRRYRNFGITGGGVTDDTMYFLISANIELYWSGSSVGNIQTTPNEKYNPRLMIGVFDPTSPDGSDYNPMMGLEFNLYEGETTTTYITKDTYIDQEFPNTNYGDNQYMEVKNELNKSRRVLVQVDLSDLSDIDAVEGILKLIIYGFFGGMVHDVHRITESWSEDTVTWNNQPTYDPVPTYTCIVPYFPDISFDVTSDIINFMNGTYTNYGWLIKHPSEDYPHDRPPRRIFYSSDYGMDTIKHPRVTITQACKGVRPFLADDITYSSPANPQYSHGDWELTGSKTYKCQLDGTNFLFYIDGVLRQTWDISDVTLDGNYKFGAGNVYDWSGFRIQLIDSASGSIGDTYNLSRISGNITYLKVVGSEDYLSTSTNSGQTWTNDTEKHLLYSVGWNYDNVKGTATDTTSINKYGTHFYKVSEDLLTTYVDCDNYAQRLVDTYKSGVATGTLIIDGRTDVDIKSKFRLSGTNLGLDKDLTITQYTYTVGKDGFTTEIAYGEAPYDIARKISELENEVF